MLRSLLIYISVYVGLFTVSYFALSLFTTKPKDKKYSWGKLPQVSVIIPAYNEEGSVKETIRSALKSDYPKDRLEVIVVDDGSEDNTYKQAKKVKDDRLTIYKKKNGGKGTALNYGIDKAEGEIIFTMDADTFVEKDSLKKMVYKFADPKVMCVAPSMAINNPKSVWERIQQIEYFLGVYLRKAFSTMNAVHITPGAFSSYRKEFFDKYGGFDEDNVTEDMEMALRVMYHGYHTRVSDKSVVYTNSPNTFVHLLKQRRRWYFGMVKNFWRYRGLFSKKYGELGMIVLPVAVTTIFLTMIITSYVVIDTVMNIKSQLALLNAINFNFSGFFSVNWFVIESFIFNIISNPIMIFFGILVLVLLSYMLFFVKKRVRKHSKIRLNITLFLLFFSVLFTFWWIVTFFYVIFVGEVSWK